MLKIRLFLITIIFFFIIPYALAEESISLTTYYPAPNGDYTNLKSGVLLVSGTATVNENLLVTGGKVGIGIASPSEKLDVDGDINVQGTGTMPGGTGHVNANAFYYSSDRRLKEHIVPITDGLKKVLALRGVSFNFKNDPSQKKIGLIAQEVEPVVPDVVLTRKDGFKSVEYGNLVAILIEAVKAQQKEIDLLKKKVEVLERAGK